MLTLEEKRKIVDYITGWSVKGILEDVDIEYKGRETQDAVSDFLDECTNQLKKWVN